MNQATRLIEPADADQRLDRWFKRHYPGLTHGRLEKLLRTGQVRVDGKRVKANHRLTAGEEVRVPPLPEETPAATKRPVAIDPHLVSDLVKRILYRDDYVLIIDKPAGLAVQGGTKTDVHLDAMLDHLRFGAPERPRLVHRLDRDTSGVLVLARSARAAAALARSFKAKSARKVYWAAVVGVPKIPQGRIDAALLKKPGHHTERVVADEDFGKDAITYYSVIAAAGRKAAWLALAPHTGRTHQLRAHCALIGTPIVGDGKYGGAKAFELGDELAKGLHLHARSIRLPHPNGGMIEASAPLPPHMRATWRFLGFSEYEAPDDPFEDVEE